MARFTQGQSGNPNGRKSGTGHRQKLFNSLVEPHREALFDTAIKLALDGNEAMLRLFLERMLPSKPQEETINFELPEGDLSRAETLSKIIPHVIEDVACGKLSPEEGRKVTAMIESQFKVVALYDFNGQIEELRKIINKKELGVIETST